jgi:lipopolysaccharide heptosyltransferase I
MTIQGKEDPDGKARTRPDLDHLSPSRVLIIKPSALGDVCNAFPALAALRAHWPEARISWVINDALRGLVEGHPAIDDVIGFERSKWGVIAFARFLTRVRRHRFDLAIDLQGLLRSGLIAGASGAPVRVGPSDAREGAGWFYTHTVATSRESEHAVDRMIAFARALGADVADARPVATMSAADREWALRTLTSVSRPRLVINLGARWETKRWPPAHFAEVARRAFNERDAGLVAVGAPEDRAGVEDLVRRLDPIPVLDLCGRTTLPQLAALAEASDLFLSNDTGPLHLAVSAGARVVGIYTCTSPALNGPYGPRSAAVATDVWCKGSYLVKCSRLECMAELTPDRVWPRVSEQLAKSKGCQEPFPKQLGSRSKNDS